MPVTCRLEDTARPAVNLDSPHLSAVRRLGAARNVQAVTELLRQRVPGLSVEEGYYDDPRPAWWEAGQVVINLNRADVSSPIHELSEIWGAVYEQQQPEAYQQTLEMMRGTDAHERTMRAYPDLDETGQLREALHLQVQQDAGKYLSGGRASSPVRRLWDFVAKLLHRLSGGLSPQRLSKLQDGKLTIAELTQALAKELVLGQGGVLSELSQQDLQRLGAYARDQRVTNTDLVHEAAGITHAGELLEFLSGQQTNAGGLNLTQKSRQLALQFGSQPTFKYTVYNEDGRKEQGEWAWESADPHERVAQVQRVLRETQAAPDGEAMRIASDLFYRLREPLKQHELSDNYPSTVSREQAQLAYGPHGMFPEFRPGEKVVRYSQAALGADYNPALDTGNLLVHLDAEGKPRGVAAITRQVLGERKNSGNLLGGLDYQKAKGRTNGALIKASAGKSERVQLSASPEQLQKLQALLLGMDLAQRGYTLDTISVANVRNLDHATHNAVTRVLPVAELQALRSIGRQAPVRQMLQASGESGQHLLALLDDDSLYDPQRYTTDYVGSLLTNFKGADSYSQQKIQQYASEHEQQQSDASLSRLLQAVVARTRQLTQDAVTPDQIQALQTNAEMVQLAHAEAQLRQVDELLNPIRSMGSVEKYILDFNNQVSPAMQFLVNRYQSLMLKLKDSFMPRAKARVGYIKALRAAKGGTSRLLDSEQELYRNLVQTQSAWQYNEDKLDAGGSPTLEQVQVPSWHFKLPGTPEFEGLLPEEQRLIEFELDQIKDQMMRWHRVSHRDPNTAELGSEKAALNYYEQEWGQGQIPLTPASVSTRRLQGDWTGSYQDSINELLSENPHFDEPGGQRLHLREYYQGQGGNTSQWGGERRRQMLGVSRTDDVHPDTGEALKFLVEKNWEKTQARFDQDLGRGQATWTVEMLRHEFQQDAERDYKLASVLLGDQETAAGVLRSFEAGTSKAGGDERVAGAYQQQDSLQAQNLEKAFRYLFLGDTQQGKGTQGAQRLGRTAAVMTSVARNVIQKLNVIRPIRTTISGFAGHLLPILLSQGPEGKQILDPKHVKDTTAIMSNPANWDYLRQLGVHNGIIDANARNLAQSHVFSGKQNTVSDAWDVDTVADRLGDEMLALYTMVLHLKTSGAWDAYSWDKDKKQFVYSEEADRRSRGDKVVDSVKTNLVANGVLEPDEKLTRAYDVNLTRSLEAAVSDVKGGYSPLSTTELGTTVLGNQLLPMRRWFVRRAYNALVSKRTSVAKGYKNADGKWVGLTEEGQFQSLTTGLDALAAISFNPMRLNEAWGGMESQEKENLSRFAMNLAVSGSMLLAVAAMAGLWDDEEDEQNKKRSRQMSVLDGIIQEAFVLDNMSFVLDAAASPLLVASWAKQFGGGLVNYLTGDFKAGNRVLSSKTGAGKMVSLGAGLLGEDEE